MTHRIWSWIYDRRSVGQSVLLSGSHLEPMNTFLFTVWRMRASWCWAPSLTRGWVGNLLYNFFWALPEQTLGPKSHRTHDHILLSYLRLHQPGGPGPRIYIPQEQGGQVTPPGTGFPFCRLLPHAVFDTITLIYNINKRNRTRLLMYRRMANELKVNANWFNTWLWPKSLKIK
jgi:hypothetical protein